ncbi:MAG: hypothetical protein ACI9MJ_000869 [Alphaproteobacteria bacterium]|jgi:hypothetical protein
MSSSDAVHAVDSTADAAFTAVKAAIADATVGDISNEAVQKLMTAAAKLYCAKLTEDQGYFGPFLESEIVTATEAVVAIAEIMRAVDLNTFDLAMWMSRPPPE